jgi:hypothetical protein
VGTANLLVWNATDHAAYAVSAPLARVRASDAPRPQPATFHSGSGGLVELPTRKYGASPLRATRLTIRPSRFMRRSMRREKSSAARAVATPPVGERCTGSRR